MIWNLQVLRGMAALFVVFVHIVDSHVVSGIPAFGRAGVDLFFVISGFIMVHVDRTRHVPAWRFMAQRFGRVAPFYYAMTLAVFLVAAAEPGMVSATRAFWPDLLRSLLFIPYVKANGLVQPVLFVGWTLNYEMFFYTLFAVSLLFDWRGARLAFLSAVITTLVLAGCLMRPDAVPAAFYTSPLLVEFLLGALLAEGLARWPPMTTGPKVRSSLMASGVIASACLFLLPVLQPRGLWAAALLSLVIVAVAAFLEQCGTVTKSRTCRSLGDASYAIYLTHPFVIGAFARIVGTASFQSVRGVVLAFVALGLAAGVGWICHVKVERPLSRTVASALGGRWPVPRRSAVLAPARVRSTVGLGRSDSST